MFEILSGELQLYYKFDEFSSHSSISKYHVFGSSWCHTFCWRSHPSMRYVSYFWRRIYYFSSPLASINHITHQSRIPNAQHLEQIWTFHQLAKQWPQSQPNPARPIMVGVKIALRFRPPPTRSSPENLTTILICPLIFPVIRRETRGDKLYS